MLTRNARYACRVDRRLWWFSFSCWKTTFLGFFSIPLYLLFPLRMASTVMHYHLTVHIPRNVPRRALAIKKGLSGGL
jgi:hypothetical protein